MYSAATSVVPQHNDLSRATAQRPSRATAQRPSRAKVLQTVALHKKEIALISASKLAKSRLSLLCTLRVFGTRCDGL